MYFDVDSTLVRPILEKEITMSNTTILIGDIIFRVNHEIINDIKLCKVRGHVVVIWSQGGSSWAAKVIAALGLSSYVDICMAKPSWYVDDRQPEDILDKSRWYDGNF